MINKTSEELIAEFPFLKATKDNPWCYGNCEGDNWFYECPEGWQQLFYNALKKINQLLKVSDSTLQVHQIKEKFGFLRFYYCLYGANNDVRNLIEDIVNKLEQDSEKTCIVCGNSAKYMSTGWISPYCEEHKPKRYVKLLLHETIYTKRIHKNM